MVERLWFQNSIEGLFVRAIGAQLGAAEKAALAKAGLRVDQMLPAYSEPVVLACLRIVGPVVLPNGTWEEQQHELGVRAVRGYFDTMLGKALAQLLRLVGPERGIARLDRSLRSITNYLNARVIARGNRSADVQVEPVGPLLHFIIGIFQGSSMLQSEGKAKAELLSHDGETCVVRLSW
jgi:uncharacterized protein (TIGR02265 family)